MKTAYPAVFMKESDGYSVVFPDLNYLATDGDSFEESKKMAIDCLSGYLYSSKIDNDNVPAPSPIETIDLSSFSKEYEIDINDCSLHMIQVNLNE